MSIVESTHSLSPFRVGERAMVDLQVNMFAAAAGLAYLSRLDEAKVLTLVRTQPDHPMWGIERVGIGEAALLGELAAIRKAGYAARRPDVHMMAESRPYHAIAAPVADASGVLGALTLLWPKRYMNTGRFAQMHAGALREAADAISADLAALP